MKICYKTHQIAPFKKKNSGKHAPEPPSKRMAIRHASQAPPPKKKQNKKKIVGPPFLANPAYAHKLLY